MADDQKIHMLIGMINELKQDLHTFCNENRKGHDEIIIRQDKTNGSIAKLKKSQLLLRGIAFGIIGTLMILGFLPERLWEILKSVF